MPRLLSWPIGVIPKKATPMSGPRSQGSGGNESTTGFIQTRSSPFGLWRWQFEFDRMKGAKARRYSGLITALHGGANAVRVKYVTGNPVEPALWGVTGYTGGDVMWSNGQPWSNGRGWQQSPPLVPVSAAAAKGATIITLQQSFWGAHLGPGDMIGFSPFHFGWYHISEDIGGGQFRIWPPLRVALTIGSVCTLEPVMAMRLESESAATFAEEVGATAESTMVLVEVEDAYIRAHFDG